VKVPWVTYAGFVVGVLSLAFTVFVYVRNRLSKRLEYEISTDERLVDDPVKWQGLEVRVKDADVAVPRLVVVRVSNSGRAPIAKDDFDGATGLLKVQVKQGRIIDHSAVRIVRRSEDAPQPLQFEHATFHEVTLNPFHLNPGDSAQIRLMLDGGEGDVSVTAYVKGSKLRPLEERMRRTYAVQSLTANTVALIVIAVMILLSKDAIPGALTEISRIGKVQVPEVVGLAAPSAERILREEGLQVRVVDPEQRSYQVSASVYHATPRPGTFVKKGSDVTIIITYPAK
jgi:hypothetical protein